MINQNINTKLDEMLDTPSVATPAIDDAEQDVLESVDSVFTGESEQVAGLGLGGLKGVLKEGAAARKALKPLEQKKIVEDGVVVQERAKAQREPGIVAPTQREKKAVQSKPLDAPVDIPENPAPLNVKPKTDKAIDKVEGARQDILEQGATPVSPAPTELQAARGVQQSIIGTIPFDDDSLRATVQATAESLKGTDVEQITVKELFDKAIERGVPQTSAAKILEGLPLESKIGNNELSIQMSGLLKLHDDSAVYIDDLFKKLETDYENFTDVDRFNLGQQLAYHDSLIKAVSGASSDIARAMNTFKRIKDQSPILSGQEFRDMLDGAIDKDSMLELAKRYNVVQSRAGKNALIKQQKGLFTKIGEGMYYTFQSNMLNDVATYARNITGSLTQGAFVTVEDFISAGVGKLRGKFGNDVSDVQELDDVVNGLHGLYNGWMDGFESMVNVFRTGERATFKGETVNNPLSSAYLADTQTEFSIFGQKFKTDPELENTFVGKSIDAIGFLQSIPFRALSGTDELISGTVARMALHRESSKFARAKIKERVDAGMSMDEAIDATSKEVATFLREQPADIYTNVEEIRQMVNFTYKFNKFAEGTVEKFVAGQYDKASRLWDVPGFKVIQPFAGTVTKIFDQGASRIPGVNFISPQFYKDWNRGGAYRDRAIARLSLGSTIASIAGVMAMENKVTGNGPGAKEDRDALAQLGWQPNSIVIETNLSEENKKRLEAITDVSVGEGRIYLSYQKLGAEPLTQIMALGADFADAMKFYSGSPNASELTDIAMAYAGSTAETVSNMPMMQLFGELATLSRGKYEDGGDKIVAIMERISTQFGKAGLLSIPGVSIAGSSAGSHIARLIDPNNPSIMPTTMNPTAAEKVLQNSWNTFVSRIPVLRGEFELDLDNAGRPKFNKDTVRQSYLNFIPNLSVTKGKMSRMDEVLAENQHGISTPSRKMHGVELNDVQYNRFKRLYGQEVMIEQDVGGELKMLNMEKAIPVALEQAMKDREEAGLPPLPIEDRRAIIDDVISKYRDVATKRMIGAMYKDDLGDVAFDEFDSTYYGFNSNKVEFPELQAEIKKTRQFNRYNPK